MNFCRLPPDRLCARGVRAAALHVEALDAAPARTRAPRATRIEAALAPCRCRCAVSSALSASDIARHRAAARAAPPARSAKPSARRRAGVAGARPASPQIVTASACCAAASRPTAPPAAPAGRCPTRRRCRRSRRRARSRCDVLERRAERIVAAQRQRRHVEPRRARRRAAPCCGCGRSPPIIMRASDRGVSCARIAVPVTRPPRSTVARVAERPDLVELVADVEDAAAFGREPAQRLEQLAHRLRRQHRRRLVHDQQPRVLQQAAHDLDALALADRHACARAAADRPAGRSVADTSRMRCASVAASAARRAARARCSRRRSASRTARSAGTPCRCRARARAPGWRSSTGSPSQRDRRRRRACTTP